MFVLCAVREGNLRGRENHEPAYQGHGMDYEDGKILEVLVSGKTAELFRVGNSIRVETGDLSFIRGGIMVVTSSIAACELWKIRGWAAQWSHFWDNSEPRALLSMDL